MVVGSQHEPAVLLLPDEGRDPADYEAMAEALADAGRHVIIPARRSNGSDEQHVGDLGAILAQLSTRPVIVGLGAGAETAARALCEGEPDLCTGLVLVGGDSDATLPPHLPAMIVRPEGSDLYAALTAPGAEWVEQQTDAPSELLDALLIEFLERRVPRTPTEYIGGSDPRTLRDALGTFATGVTIVTARAPDGTNVGLTANSFTSVSLDPPLLLVCPHRQAHSMAVFSEVDHFAVNVLHIGQQSVSDLFARKSDDRFERVDWEVWDHGPPILTNSLASFECRKFAEYDGGDHVILVGEVKRVRFAPQRDPLLYFRGKYRRLHFA
ncbi:flavin reductase [Sphingomicrobium clamense]|nr:flavin reductase [Sphingomicrobium sp. B8]